MTSSRILVLTSLFLFIAIPVLAQDGALNVGDEMPPFSAETAEGTIWNSADHVGDGLLVVYFYPAAMTGGCTDQACSFRDNRSKLSELGARVVGVSGDTVEGLEVFRRTNRINFPLLSDEHGRIARLFGVPVNDGGTFVTEVDGEKVELERGVTSARWTFIVDESGTIVYRDTDVNPAGDGEAVLAAVERLAAR